MENKFKPFFQMIPILADVITTSSAYKPEGGLEDEIIDDDDGPILDNDNDYVIDGTVDPG